MRLRKPIPITRLDCKPLISKQGGELIKFIELVFAWRKRRTELKQKSAELAGFPQWFNLCQNSLGDKTLRLGRENHIPSRVSLCIASDVRRQGRGLFHSVARQQSVKLYVKEKV